MNIYFNRKPVQGPWGGGSKVLLSIVHEALKRGHTTLFERDIYTRKDIDLLVCVDPRPAQVCFGDIVNYANTYKKKIVQRIGDLGTHGKPELFNMLRETTKYASIVVFPSEWARDTLDSSNKNAVVIPNAPLKCFREAKKLRDFGQKVKIVSHHWSDNVMKGFDTYASLDAWCSSRQDFEFTFVGRKPASVTFKNYVEPLDSDGLVRELPKHDVYITASKKEAGANHVLEAAALGLPILYNSNGGSIIEYCRDFGMSYDTFDDVISILTDKLESLKSIAREMSYTRTAEDMAIDYVNLFERL